MSGTDPVPPAAPSPPPPDDGSAAHRSRRERGAEFVASVRDRADTTRATMVERRTSSPLIDAGFRLNEHNRAVGGAVLAGAVAFRIFVFAVPFVFVFVTSLGLYGGATTTADAAEAGGISGIAARAVEDASGNSHGFQVTALIAGIFALLWAAYSLARVVRIASALAWRCDLPRIRRPWAPPLVVTGVAIASVALMRLLKAARDHFGGLGTGATLGAVILFAVMWLAVSLLLPRREGTNWFDLVPGAVLVSIGLQGLQLATVYYFAGRISSLSDRYGALGTALGLLSWAYVVGWLITGSALLNAVVHDAIGRNRSRWFPAARSTPDVGGGP